MSGYPTSTSIPQVDGLSTDPRVLGRHKHKSFKILLQVIPKGDFTLVHWTIEYEKLNKDITTPLKELGFLIHLSEHIDDHLVQA